MRFNAGMPTPNVFLAYAPRSGLRCALAYLASERDVYGWFTGPRPDASTVSCYFVLEDFYANHPTRYQAVAEAELHSGWLLSEPRRHELARMQDIVAREWLVGRNVRFERLAKLSKRHSVWTYYSPRFERPVLKYLATHWPLEYRLHEEAAAAPRRRSARSCP